MLRTVGWWPVNSSDRGVRDYAIPDLQLQQDLRCGQPIDWGRVTLLRREPFAQLLKPLVSSDGRRIAFARGQIDSNVWMVSGF